MKEDIKPQNIIRIGRKLNKDGIYTIWSSNGFFQNHKAIVFESDKYGCTFRRVSIDDIKTCAVSTNGFTGVVINVNVDGETLPVGKFEIDHSETTEDSVTFNY